MEYEHAGQYPKLPNWAVLGIIALMLALVSGAAGGLATAVKTAEATNVGAPHANGE